MRSRFRSKFDFNFSPSPSGDRIHIHFEPRFNGTRIELVESGHSDIRQSINAYAPFCDLPYMLSRLRIGDSSVLSSRQPMYGDLSGLPSNPADAVNLVRIAENRFNQLPAVDRQNFNNDWRVWLSDVFSSRTGCSSDKPSSVPDSVEKE